MRIPIDPSNSTPIYQQIERFLRNGIRQGALPPGSRLPASRELSAELGVSRVTVETAYANLEADGLVERRTGSGTFILPPEEYILAQPAASASWPLWQEELAAAAIQPPPAPLFPSVNRSADTISFTGFGDPRRFPTLGFFQAIKEVMRRDGVDALSLSDPRGYMPLRETVAQVLSSQGVQTRAESVLVTSGSQQALAMVVHLLLKPGDTVLVESPTYNVALDLFRANRLKVTACPIDADGMRTGQLEALLQQFHPRLIYTIPTFQNPSGTCLSLARRKEFIRLAACYNVPILEDDFAGELGYDGRSLPALRALDPGGNVIYTGSFSKMLMPGLRMGFITAAGPVFEQLAYQKQMTDLATPSLIQRAIEQYVTLGRYRAHLRRSCQAYRRRRDAMASAIRRNLPREASFDLPRGGLFIWLRLPPDLDSNTLLPYALAAGVTYTPGTRFFPMPVDGAPWLRLNFAVRTPEEIEEGIQRLGKAIARCRQQGR